MATKGKAEGGERSNRLRFVMLEADLSDTNVNALAQAIVSALRETPSAPKPLSPMSRGPARLPAAAAPGNGHERPAEPDPVQQPTNDESASDEEQEASAPAQPSSRTRKPQRPPQPEYIDTLFPTTAEADAFKAFVAQYPTKKHSERYLVSALYLRNHGHPVVNMDKVYTCYRINGWPMTVNDWDVNLRNQIRNDRFRRTEGGYSITTNGESIVQALRGTA